MKRYYTIDISVMTEAKLSPLEWMVLENIHFLCSNNGWCYATKKTLADHHNISTQGYHKIRARLEADGWIKNNNKNYLKTTKKWHLLNSDRLLSSVNKVDADRLLSSDETINKVDAYPIKKEIKEREEEREAFPKKLQEWIDYKKSRKDKLVEATLKSLLKQHNKDPIIFAEKVDNSIANGYQGLFLPKQQNNYESKQPEKGSLDWHAQQQKDITDAEII